MIKTILTKSFSTDTALLVMRVLTGSFLIHHGFEKLANIENFADAFVRPLHLPFPILLSYVAAASEIGGSWLIILGIGTRLGAASIVGTIGVAIYHSLVTAGFNIYLLELLALYEALAIAILLAGPGIFSLDELIVRIFESRLKKKIDRIELFFKEEKNSIKSAI